MTCYTDKELYLETTLMKEPLKTQLGSGKQICKPIYYLQTLMLKAIIYTQNIVGKTHLSTFTDN